MKDDNIEARLKQQRKELEDQKELEMLEKQLSDLHLPAEVGDETSASSKYQEEEKYETKQKKVLLTH